MILQIDLAPETYDFSFTAASLRLSEMRSVAIQLASTLPFDFGTQLGNGKAATGKRMFFEYSKRLNTLNPSELDILINGDLISQKQIAFVSVCRSYAFIRDFVLEVIREKFLMFDYQIIDRDYTIFFKNKLELHPELEQITENTTSKIKQVTFKILEQADIIDNIKGRNIQIQLIEDKTIKAIAVSGKEWLRVLLMTDTDIQNISNP
ncbi:BrxA [Spirosomataceae bacterium]